MREIAVGGADFGRSRTARNRAPPLALECVVAPQVGGKTTREEMGGHIPYCLAECFREEAMMSCR